MWPAVVLMLIKLYCPSVGIEQHTFLQNIESIFACWRLVYMELCILCVSLRAYMYNYQSEGCFYPQSVLLLLENRNGLILR